MKGYWKLVVLMVLTLALAGLLLAVTSAWAGPEGASPTAPMASAGVVSGTISYQGRLLQGSTPVNGSCEITFNLYTQASGGAPLWSQSRDVAVNSGLFNVDLTPDPALFNGQALWLGARNVAAPATRASAVCVFIAARRGRQRQPWRVLVAVEQLGWLGHRKPQHERLWRRRF